MFIDELFHLGSVAALDMSTELAAHPSPERVSESVCCICQDADCVTGNGAILESFCSSVSHFALPFISGSLLSDISAWRLHDFPTSAYRMRSNLSRQEMEVYICLKETEVYTDLSSR